MRVTKTVKEYIYKEVQSRMGKKYEAEAAEANRQMELYEAIEKDALAAATAMYKTVIRKGIEDNSAGYFLTIENENSENGLYRSPGSPRLVIINKNRTDTVHGWRCRMRAEVEEKVNEIIVSLELGGTREELMKMLAEI